jgi:hypothetical protein
VAPDPSDTQTLLLRHDGKITSEEDFADIPNAVAENGTVDVPCPRCNSRLVNPDTLGWCPKCGYCRSLEEGASKVPPSAEPAPHNPSPMGIVEFCQLLAKVPTWSKVLLAGSAALALFSLAANLFLPSESFPRALVSTLQLGLGLLCLLAAHVWALILIAPGDDQLSIKDVILCNRLWALTLRRLPEMRKQVWLGGWGISAAVWSILLIGGFSFWTQYYKPKRVADKNLVQAINEAGKDKGKDKSLEDAVKEFADSQDLTKKKNEEKDKNLPKVDKRATVHCVVIGYQMEDEKTLSGLVVATLNNDKLNYAGIVRRGFTPAASTELLERLGPLGRSTPFIPGLEVSAIWVKPEVLCEVHQSGYDEIGHLKDPNYKGLLQRE